MENRIVFWRVSASAYTLEEIHGDEPQLQGLKQGDVILLVTAVDQADRLITSVTTTPTLEGTRTTLRFSPLITEATFSTIETI
jgi:hypothetical protein